MNNDRLASFFIRLGIAFAFVYAAISAFITPENWIGFMPSWISAIPVDQFLILQIFSGVEILLGLWLITGKKLFYSAIVSAVFLAGITIVNIGALDIVFRDITIFLAAIALAILARDY